MSGAPPRSSPNPVDRDAATTRWPPDEELLLLLEHPGGRLVLCGWHLWGVHAALVARAPHPERGGLRNNLALTLGGVLWFGLVFITILVASIAL